MVSGALFLRMCCASVFLMDDRLLQRLAYSLDSHTPVTAMSVFTCRGKQVFEITYALSHTSGDCYEIVSYSSSLRSCQNIRH